MTGVREFQQAMLQAVDDTPYAFTPTETGGIVHLDLADAHWYGLLSTSGLRAEHAVQVWVDSGRYRPLQGSRMIEWTAGTPRTSGEIRWAWGWELRWSKRQVWALDPTGRLAKVVDYTFDSREPWNLVAAVAKPLGLRLGMPGRVKVAAAAATVGLVAAVVTAVVIIVLLATGYEQVCTTDGNVRTCTMQKT